MKTARCSLFVLASLAATASWCQPQNLHSPGDHGPALKAQICDPTALTVTHGVLFVAESCTPAIRAIDLKTNLITTLIRFKPLTVISDLKVDKDGNLIAADSVHNRVLRIKPNSGSVEVVAGTNRVNQLADPDWGFSGDGGPATKAKFSGPDGVAIDQQGNIFVSDGGNSLIRRIDAQTGIITTVVGSGKRAESGDEGPALEAGLEAPMSLAVDHDGNIYFAEDTNDSAKSRIRKVDSKTGLISTFFAEPDVYFALLLDTDGSLLVGDGKTIRRFDLKTGSAQTVAGSEGGKTGDGGPALNTRLEDTNSFVFDENGNLYICSFDSHSISRVRAKDGIIETFAGNGWPHHAHIIM